MITNEQIGNSFEDHFEQLTDNGALCVNRKDLHWKTWHACALWAQKQILDGASEGFEEAYSKINVYEGYELAQKEMWQAAILAAQKAHAGEIEKLKQRLEEAEGVIRLEYIHCMPCSGAGHDSEGNECSICEGSGAGQAKRFYLKKHGGGK